SCYHRLSEVAGESGLRELSECRSASHLSLVTCRTEDCQCSSRRGYPPRRWMVAKASMVFASRPAEAGSARRSEVDWSVTRYARASTGCPSRRQIHRRWHRQLPELFADACQEVGRRWTERLGYRLCRRRWGRRQS